MRSTVRIDDDLMVALRTYAAEEGLSVTRMLNRLLRLGISALGESGESRPPLRQTTYSMGRPRLAIDKALALAAALEDEEIARKMSLRK